MKGEGGITVIMGNSPKVLLEQGFAKMGADEQRLKFSFSIYL